MTRTGLGNLRRETTRKRRKLENWRIKSEKRGEEIRNLASIRIAEREKREKRERDTNTKRNEQRRRGSRNCLMKTTFPKTMNSQPGSNKREEYISLISHLKQLVIFSQASLRPGTSRSCNLGTMKALLALQGQPITGRLNMTSSFEEAFAAYSVIVRVPHWRRRGINRRFPFCRWIRLPWRRISEWRCE